ncbi:hypothetical protein FJZ21_00205 [Candidatus Pacearchaeota archaeon]|nr:hypothetical protein [Candidatus Pacearchaeota archaeon]
MNKAYILLAIGLILFAGTAYAISVDSVMVDEVAPGQEGIIRINVENDGNDNIESLSIRINFPNSNIIPVGRSEEFLSTLEEDEEESFIFRFKVSNVLSAGTYLIEYDLSYEQDNSDIEQSGNIGIVVSAEPEIEISANTQNSVVGIPGELQIRIINKGLADARFVNLKIESKDLIFLSENSEYIGTIDSDDFETSSFEVIYSNKFPSINVRITYKDFNNEEQEIIKTASLRAYTNKEAVEKGILTKNNASRYVRVIILFFFLWIIYRFIKKRRKKRD